MQMAALPDIDPQETQEWLEALDGVLEVEGPQRAHFILERLIEKARRSGAYLPYNATTAYVNTIRPRPGGALAGRPRAGAPHPLLHPLERDGDGGARQQGVLGAGRPHRQLRLGGDAVRRGLQPLLARARAPSTAAIWSSSRATPPRASTRAPSWKAASARSSCDHFRQEVDGKGLSSYPHPWLMPDFWQFPTVSMGLGPIMAIYQARFMRYLKDRGLLDTDEPQGVGLPGRRRDGRAGIARRHLAGRAREARQPDLRGQLQPAAAGRPGARQRQDHPGAGSRLPRRRLERHQGDLGFVLGSAARARHQRAAAQAHGGSRRRRVPGLQVQGRRLRARALLRQVPGAARDGRQHVRRRHLAAQPRRPRPAQDLCRLHRRREPQGPADRDSGQDHQGLRHGRVGRGPEHHPPAEEDGHHAPSRPSATASTFRSRTTSSRRCRSSSPPRTARR